MLLRTPRLDDADALYPLVAGTSVVDTLVWNGPTSFDAFRERWGTTVTGAEAGTKHCFVIADPASSAPAGVIELRPMKGLGSERAFRADIGLWIGIPYQRRGLGTAAVLELTDYGFGRVGLEKIEATVFVGNDASRRMFEKAGFLLEGTIRCALKKRSRFVDEWLFGRLRGAPRS